MQKKLSLGFATLLCIQGAVAEEDSFKGEGKLGLTNTSGNTETQTIVGNLKLGYTMFKWEHEAKLETLRAEDGQNLTAERYSLDLQSDYKLPNKISYLWGNFRYEDDKFSGYNYQTALTVGYGHKVIDTARTKLDLEAGVGIRKSELKAGSEPNDDLDREPIARFGLDYSQEISSNLDFTQNFLVETGSENTHLESRTGFNVKIVGNLKMGLSLDINHNTEVPPGTEKTDTITAVNLLYSF